MLSSTEAIISFGPMSSAIALHTISNYFIGVLITTATDNSNKAKKT